MLFKNLERCQERYSSPFGGASSKGTNRKAVQAIEMTFMKVWGQKERHFGIMEKQLKMRGWMGEVAWLIPSR